MPSCSRREFGAMSKYCGRLDHTICGFILSSPPPHMTNTWYSGLPGDEDLPPQHSLWVPFSLDLMQQVDVDGDRVETSNEWRSSVFCWDQHCQTSLSVTWTVRLSAPSASLLKTPSFVVWSTCWREGMPSRGTWTGLRGGPVWTSWSSTRPSARFCTWVTAIPRRNRPEQTESSPGEKD